MWEDWWAAHRAELYVWAVVLGAVVVIAAGYGAVALWRRRRQ
jgi:hypothetical protein